MRSCWSQAPVFFLLDNVCNPARLGDQILTRVSSLNERNAGLFYRPIEAPGEFRGQGQGLALRGAADRRPLSLRQLRLNSYTKQFGEANPAESGPAA